MSFSIKLIILSFENLFLIDKEIPTSCIESFIFISFNLSLLKSLLFINCIIYSFILIKLLRFKLFSFASTNCLIKFSKLIGFALPTFAFSKYWLIKLKIVSISSFSVYFGKSISISVDENQFQGHIFDLLLSF